MVAARFAILAGSVWLAGWAGASAAGDDGPASAPVAGGESPSLTPDVLTPQQSAQVERSVDKALAWMATQQSADGSFRTLPIGQPGVTALCVLAYLSRGHLPGQGPYGAQMDAAVESVLSCQQTGGLIARLPTPPGFSLHSAAHTNIYNHAISGLMLAEIYGMSDSAKAPRIRQAVERAVAFTRQRQIAPKPFNHPEDNGGWRYLRPWYYRDSDLSVTGWQLMFLRSARNAGFDVPAEYIDEALAFVDRCYDPDRKCFVYSLSPDGNYPTRGMVGAGILSLSLAGRHDTPAARAAGDWVLGQSFDAYNRRTIDPRKGTEATSRDRYHYSAYYCTQAMFQLGGRYWERFYPPLADTLVANQNAEGSWQAEVGEDNRYGNVYTTALTVITLCTPYQLLPIYQR